MSKEEIDKAIQLNWSEINNKKELYQRASKWHVDDDVIGWAYDYVIKNRHKLKSSTDVVAFFIQRIGNACYWRNSGYLDKNKEVNLEEEKIVYFGNENIEEITSVDCSIVNDFEKTLNNHEKILLNLMLTGYDNSGKLSRFTSIPRTSCHLMIREIKTKLKNYVENLQENEVGNGIN